MLRINELNALRGAKPRRSRISVHDLPFNCELKSPAQGGLGVLDGPRADARSPSDFIQISTCLGLSSISTTPSPGAIFLLDVVPIILPRPKCNAAFALVKLQELTQELGKRGSRFVDLQAFLLLIEQLLCFFQRLAARTSNH